MDRVQITFPDGISGIVGPNGCGKSNIVDSIRWCMGEQSPKQLRGRQMEDVIFNGTGTHKPMGMAEVTIVLENVDSALPPGYSQHSEISITRRLYRSGESEYLINNIPCRLKDIQELFMDTGLGNRAYSVIGQGRIGAILEQKPEETRVMLEEAAGITKYRKKVEDSQKKIKLTEENLQRVEDILSEVQRQMRSLKRQASKARRFKAISEEIRQIELELNANLYNELKLQVEQKTKSTENLIQQELALTTTIAQIQAKIEHLYLELEEKDAQLGELRKGYLAARDRVQRKEAALESLNRELELQKEMEARLSHEREETRERIEKLGQEKLELEQRLEQLKRSFDELGAEIGMREQRMQSRKETLAQVRKEYERAREILSTKRDRETGLKHESGYLAKLLSQVTDSQKRLHQELENAGQRMEALKEASRKKQWIRDAETERLEEIENSIEQDKAAALVLEQDKEDIEKELRAAQSELSASQSRLASLETLAQNFEGYKVGVRTIMKAKDLEPRQNGKILGLVADVIEVDPKYEQAVEAVLADKLQYIIVETHEDGKRAVDYLKTKAKGRSSFVPLKELNGNGAGAHANSPYLRLKDIITAPEPFKPLINALLGDTVVVEDLDTAISAWRNNGRNQCLVTLEGDMVDERGIISGGKLTHGSRGLLARKREINELKERVVFYEERVNALELRREEIRNHLETIKDKLEEQQEQRWECQQRINNIDNTIFRIGQEMDQLEKLVQSIKADLDKKAREEQAHAAKLLEVKEALEKSEASRIQEEAYFKEKEKELEECEGEFEQSKENLAKLKADLRILQEEERGILRELERIESYQEESYSHMKKIDGDIEEARQKQDLCVEEINNIKFSLEDLHEVLHVEEKRVQHADHERQELQSNIKKEEKGLEQLRGELNDLKEKINLGKMEQSEIRIKMKNLVDMTQENFGINLEHEYTKHVLEDFSEAETRERLKEKKEYRQKLGEVNLTAIQEHEALKERYEFIKNQREDLLASIESLRKAIKKINRTSLEKFMHTFRAVDEKLKEIFPILFGGGSAGLKLTEESKPLESGVLVEVRPPGKKLSHMGLLSGGEKALVAMALLFSIYMIKPSPFCLLDEVDAPLDEANIDRFNDLLQEIKKSSQIIMITHNRKTMEIVDRLYGVTMEEAGLSKVVSVDIEGLKERQQLQ